MNGIAGEVKGGRAVWLAAHAGYLVNLQNFTVGVTGIEDMFLKAIVTPQVVKQ